MKTRLLKIEVGEYLIDKLNCLPSGVDKINHKITHNKSISHEYSYWYKEDIDRLLSELKGEQ